MTKFLKSVRSGVRFGAFRGLIYGVEKVGKSSFPLGAETVLYADIEGRIDHLDCQSVAIATWKDMNDLLEELRSSKHDFKTLVVDSISVLEKRLKDYIMDVEGLTPGSGRKGAEAWGGQWLKTAYGTYWPMFWVKVERLQRERDMTIWYTAHCDVRNMTDPHGGDAYQRYRPDMGGKVGPQSWLHHVDVALFAEFKDIIRTEKSGAFGGTKVKLSSTGRRVAHTTHRPSHDAGNSWNLPASIPLDYATFEQLRRASKAAVKEVVEEIEALLNALPQGKRAAARKFIKANATNLSVMQGFLARVQSVAEEEALRIAQESEASEAEEAEKETA